MKALQENASVNPAAKLIYSERLVTNLKPNQGIHNLIVV